jgi:glucose-1-phosphate cytidylyltransferase
MQVVILAGGLGTRLSEETDLIPKPMVLVGPDPILVHIMRYYAAFGHQNFIIAAGYKHEIISKYFDSFNSNWQIEVVDTGLDVSTGGRLLKLKSRLEDEFMLTYGDGLGDVDLTKLHEIFSENEYLAVVTATRPPARFGSLRIQGNLVTSFNEKDPQDAGWINGGFFICSKEIINYITSLTEPLEGKPISDLVDKELLGVYEHPGWWHPMDTLRDKRQLQEIWDSGNAPWEIKRVGPPH